MISGCVPKNFGVAFRMNQYGIFLVSFPGTPVIQTVGKTLGAIVKTRPEGDQRRIGFIGGQTGGVLVIDYAGSRLNTTVQLLLPKCGLEFGPVNEIATHRVNPALGPSLGK